MLAIYGGALRYPPLFDDAHLGSLTLGFGTPRWLAQGSFVLIGGDVVWQRLANLELHFATALLLCGFLARLFAAVQDKEGDALVLAFFGALWFLVHPVAVYGVAYLAQRSIILATLFSIAALWCVLEGLLRRAPLWHAAALAAYFLALSSKEAAVALPAVAAALAVLLRERTGPSRAFWWALAGCAALAAAVIVQRRDLLGALYEPLAPEVLARMAVDPTVLYPLSVSNQATLFFRYLGTWLVPWPGWMSVDVRTAFPRELVGWHLLGFLAWLAYGALAARLLWRGGRAGLAGFGLLFPWLLALTELAAVRIQEPFVLYRSYLWMSGLPAIFPAVLAPLSPRVRAAGMALLCAAMAVIAHGRVETFSSAVALWDDAVRRNTDLRAPFVERGFVSRGLALLEAGHAAAAAADIERALELNPGFADAWYVRATVRMGARRWDEALADLDRALALRPSYAAAYHQRCIVKLNLQRPAAAFDDCLRSVELNSLDDAAWSNLGFAERVLGLSDEAAASFERALKLKPDNPPAHFNYGALLLNRGRPQAALPHFAAACRGGMPNACELERELRAPASPSR